MRVVVKTTPRPLYTLKENWCPLYRRLGWRQAVLDWCGKSRSPPELDPQFFLPVEDYAIPAHGWRRQ